MLVCALCDGEGEQADQDGSRHCSKAQVTNSVIETCSDMKWL